MILKCYADESWDDSSQDYLTVAGFLMTDGQFVHLDGKWEQALERLPYFHMKERHHIKHPNVYHRLVSCLARGSVRAGFSACVNKQHYDRRVKAIKSNKQSYSYWHGGSYTFALFAFMENVGRWLESNDMDSKVTYFFEAGHPRQGEACDFMGKLASDAQLYPMKQRCRYVSHTFLEKKSELGRLLQAADILSWNLTEYHRTGQHTPESQAILSNISVNCVYYDQPEIDAVIDGQATVSQFYGEVRKAAHDAGVRERQSRRGASGDS